MIFKTIINKQITNDFAAYELCSSGPSKCHASFDMGRFDIVPGVQEEGSPVYRQAHSKEIPNTLGETRLYRW